MYYFYHDAHEMLSANSGNNVRSSDDNTNMASCLRVQLSNSSRCLCRFYCSQNGWRAENSRNWNKALSASGLLLVSGTALWLGYRKCSEGLTSVKASAPPISSKAAVNISCSLTPLIITKCF